MFALETTTAIVSESLQASRGTFRTLSFTVTLVAIFYGTNFTIFRITEFPAHGTGCALSFVPKRTSFASSILTSATYLLLWGVAILAFSADWHLLVVFTSFAVLGRAVH